MKKRFYQDASATRHIKNGLYEEDNKKPEDF